MKHNGRIVRVHDEFYEYLVWYSTYLSRKRKKKVSLFEASMELARKLNREKEDMFFKPMIFDW